MNWDECAAWFAATTADSFERPPRPAV